MKRFEFSLERVRRWRREQANLEELKLQQMRGELARLETAQRQIETDIINCERETLSEPSLDPLMLVSMDAYRQGARGKIQQLVDRQRRCSDRIAEQFKRVVEARRRFELLDKLRNDALDQWQTASDKEQEDLAAELYLAKIRRERSHR